MQLFFYALLHQWKQVLKFVQRWLFEISNRFGNFQHVTDFGESLVYLFSTLRYLITLPVSAFYGWISLIYIANAMDWVALEGSEHQCITEKLYIWISVMKISFHYEVCGIPLYVLRYGSLYRGIPRYGFQRQYPTLDWPTGHRDIHVWKYEQMHTSTQVRRLESHPISSPCKPSAQVS